MNLSKADIALAAIALALWVFVLFGSNITE